MGPLEDRFPIPQSRSQMGQIVQWIEAQVVMLLFWSAIFLPLGYLALLVTRVHSSENLVLFLVLVGLHIVALIGGHPYHRSIDS